MAHSKVKIKLKPSKTYGDEMVKKWRRSYDIPPPKLSELEVAEEKIKPTFQLIMAMIGQLLNL